jgi:hypothetical protein
MKTPILGSAYVARSVNAADNRMVNLFPEVVPEGGKEPAFLQRAPGLRLLATIGIGPIRGFWVAGEYAYCVSGNTFYRISSDWSYQAFGTISGSGPVSMSDNGVQIFIAANPFGYIFNTATSVFGEITDPNFPGAVTVGFLDGYFVFNEPNSQRIWVTALNDGTLVDPLDFASAEGSPDDIVSIMVDHREVWVFGVNTVEVWYNAGTPDFPLARIQGAFNEIGCIAPYSVAKLDNGLFWLGADARGRGIVYRSKGYSGERVSTHSVEWQIQQYDDMSDAIGFTYQQDGHAFYVLVFPSADTTWVYDVATGSWHERASWQNNAFARFRGNCQMSYANEIVVGDYDNGNIYALDLTDYTDNGETQKWLRSWRALPTGQNDLKRTTQHSLQLDCESGVGITGAAPRVIEDITSELGEILTAEYALEYVTAEDGLELVTESGAQLVLYTYSTPDLSGYYITTEASLALSGHDPQVMLRWSDDGGHTWSNEHWKSMGKVGEYGRRVIWRRLGMTLKIRDRVYEISGTDPVKVAIMGAELIVDRTNA